MTVMNKNYNQNEINFHKEKILSDLTYFDSSLSLNFCIALQLVHINSMFLIGDNLSAIYKDAFKKNTELNMLHIITKNYFNKYLTNNPKGIGEFLKVFLKDRHSTTEKFKSLKQQLKQISDLEEINAYSNIEDLKKVVGPFDDGVAEFRYFNDKNIRKYFFLAFCTKLNSFTKEEVQKGFEYFINVLIPISEKFYSSGYIQYHSGIEDLEKSIKSVNFNSLINTEVSFFQKFKNLFN